VIKKIIYVTPEIEQLISDIHTARYKSLEDCNNTYEDYFIEGIKALYRQEFDKDYGKLKKQSEIDRVEIVRLKAKLRDIASLACKEHKR